MRSLQWFNFATARKPEFEGLITRMTLKLRIRFFSDIAYMIHY